MLHTIKHTENSIAVLLLDDTSDSVMGILTAHKTEPSVYTVTRSVVYISGRGLGVQLYKIAMQYLYEIDCYLSASCELTQGSAKVWEKLSCDVDLSYITKTEIPSFDIPLCYVPDDHYCYYAYNMIPTSDFYINKIIDNKNVDKLIQDGLSLFAERLTKFIR